MLLLTVACSKGSFEGFVYSVNKKPINNAIILIDGNTSKTDKNGYFVINKLSEGLHKITITKNGYAPHFKTIPIVDTKISSRKFFLNPIKIIRNIDFTKNNRINRYNVGFEFKKDTFIDSTNTIVNKGHIHYSIINVQNDGILAMPGELRGESDNGTVTALKTYGMIELTALSKGKELQIKKGKYVTLKLPIQGGIKPRQVKMPVWIFNKEKGIWKFHGNGEIITINNKKWVKAKIRHLSYINLDVPVRLTTVWIKQISNIDSTLYANITARGIGQNFISYSRKVNGVSGYCLEVVRNVKCVITLDMLVKQQGSTYRYFGKRYVYSGNENYSCINDHAYKGTVIANIHLKKKKVKKVKSLTKYCKQHGLMQKLILHNGKSIYGFITNRKGRFLKIATHYGLKRIHKNKIVSISVKICGNRFDAIRKKYGQLVKITLKNNTNFYGAFMQKGSTMMIYTLEGVVKVNGKDIKSITPMR